MKYYRDFEREYEKALYKNDKETLAYFASFGKNPNQAIHNLCQYQANLACGFIAPFREENGWLQNERIETETLPIMEGSNYMSIKVGKLPNDRWVAESSVFIELGGYSSPVSVFSDSYSTREEAILKQLERIKNYINKNTKNPSAYLKFTDSFWHKLYAQQIELFN